MLVTRINIHSKVKITNTIDSSVLARNAKKTSEGLPSLRPDLNGHTTCTSSKGTVPFSRDLARTLITEGVSGNEDRRLGLVHQTTWK